MNLDKDIKRIKSRGFNYIKVEIEATFNDYLDITAQCSQCGGVGDVECPDCDGSGSIVDEENGDFECRECGGGGRVECDVCDGDGEGDEEEAFGDFQRDFEDNLHKVGIMPTYLCVYKDCTVSIEATLTFRVEDIPELSHVIDIFCDTCSDMWKVECTSKNAGLHIALLTTEVYPSRVRMYSTPEEQLRLDNFKRAMSLILPVLYPLASPGDGTTRGYSYRMPRISNNDKYSAIYTHDDSCLEYRIFDPVFNDHKRINHYIRVISKTLKFYSKINHLKNIGKLLNECGDIESMAERIQNKLDVSYDGYNADLCKSLNGLTVKELVGISRALLGGGKKVRQAVSGGKEIIINKLARIKI